MSIIRFDEQLTIAINSLHSPFFDVLMFNISKTFIWVPFYALLIFLLFRQYGKHTWLKLLFIVVLIFLADQTSVHVFKNVFMRLRPCHNPEMLAQGLHLVNGKCGGTYGFISSHATNTFALTTFLFFEMRQKYSWIGWLFLWAGIIAYSRVYLGVHYLGDVVFGALWGMGIGYLVFRIESLVSRKVS
ncbi:MAG: phosphatase PAP2 family protein [Bacteroidales bacterium]|nr:phosphatase PAP2 family protein [Bacteroidales bacterium]